MVKNLLEEVGFAGLSWPSNKNGCRVPEGKHFSDGEKRCDNALNSDLYSA